MSTKGRETYSIQSVENALDVLEALCDEEDDVRISRLSEKLGMNKMSVFRHLATFESRGYVEKAKGSDKYRLGLTAYEVGQKLLSRMGLLKKARPVVERLVRECDEAAYLVVRRGPEALFLDMVDTSQQVKVVSLVGRRFPLEISAAGRILLAHAAGDHPDVPSLAELISVIRLQGFSTDLNALGEGIASVAVPLLGAGGVIEGTLCMVGPDFRLPQDRIDAQLLPRLLEAGNVISSKLGYFGDGWKGQDV